MNALRQYTDYVLALEREVELIDVTLSTVDLALNTADAVLMTPEAFAAYLRTRSTAVKLNQTVVTVLGGFPYGIGFAIKQLDRVADNVSGALQAQVRIMEALDRAWQPAQTAVNGAGQAVDQAQLIFRPYQKNIETRGVEVRRLGLVRGGVDLPSESRLVSRMQQYGDRIASSQRQRQQALALLPRINGIATSLTDAAENLKALLPSLPALQSTINNALGFFFDAADTAKDLYDALNITIDPPFLPPINLISAIETITNFIGIAQDFIEGFVIDILEGLGFNTNIFSGVEAAVLDLLNPLFSVLSGLQAATVAAVADIFSSLGELGALVGNLLEDAIPDALSNTLFDGLAVVDNPAGGSATGRDGAEDGIFGSTGNDTLRGGAGDGAGTDFLFGGPGDDLVSGGAGADELYGDGGDDQLAGGPGPDLLSGGPGDDALHGNAGNDTLIGNGGNDTLIGNRGNDTLAGGGGNDLYRFDADSSLGSDLLTDAGGRDRIDFEPTRFRSVDLDLAVAAAQRVNDNLLLRLGSASAFEDVIGGSRGDGLRGNGRNNLLNGGPGDDTLIGRLGNDTLIGNRGNDTLAGGGGNDLYRFDADRPLGSDRLFDGSGFDTLDFSPTGSRSIRLNLASTATQTLDPNLKLTLAAANAFENITGGSRGDTLSGNARANRLIGNGGNDTLIGNRGNDTLAGGGGNDLYRFDADRPLGSDRLFDGSGFDTLDFSPTGSHSIRLNLASTATQTLDPNLKLTLAAANAFENITGGSRGDTLSGNARANRLIGNGGNDTLIGNRGNDTLAGGGGNDLYRFDADRPLGSDRLFDGSGFDTLDFSPTGSRSIRLNLASTATQTLDPNLKLTLAAANAFENITGGSRGDTLSGNARANRLIGNGGNDTLIGNRGNDTLAGGGGNDLYRFDADRPLGSDRLFDGSGFDTLDFSPTGSHSIRLNLASTATQTLDPNLKLTLAAANAFENITGGSRGDTLSGNARANRLIGNGGNDTLSGGLANDTLIGNRGADLLSGNRGADNLSGNRGNDTLIGNRGNDTLAGGGGRDLLTGSLGRDTFLFSAPLASAGVDAITDFTVGQGDRIALDRAIYSAFPAAGPLDPGAFRVGAGATTASHRILYNSSSGSLFYDPDGNGAAVPIPIAELAGGLPLSAAGFLVV